MFEMPDALLLRLTLRPCDPHPADSRTMSMPSRP
jgi:hypothetical protein